ncbi:MAG: adenosylhomocysteinase [Candidatus Aenigmarchaeota archaeon]|nr:adenosylhomocysteinase [Candidatus Aenigmarchaeota archaeon]
MSKVKDMSLAEQGLKQIEWAESQMGALLEIKKRFTRERPLEGYRIGMCLHITKETAVLVRTLAAGGASVAITGCNPLSTQDDVAAALALEGHAVFGWKGETNEEYYENLNAVLNMKPHITIDDGCDLVTIVHIDRKDLLNNIIGGAEETTTGIIRLRAMEKENILRYPIIAVNDSKTKHLMDNFYGTGQSTIDGIVRSTNILLAGKNFVVSGYGNCGKGVALRAKGMGANIIVTEVDPIRALQAVYDGFRVMPLKEAVPIGDIFVTVTGNKHVISMSDMEKMRDGAILANSGHFNAEIDVQSLDMRGKKKNIRPGLDEYMIDEKRIFLLGEGRLVNLATAEGHPSTVMATSFCNQALAIEYLIKNKSKLRPGVHVLSDEMDRDVARMQLDALGIKIDSLTEMQRKYLDSWDEGT